MDYPLMTLKCHQTEKEVTFFYVSIKKKKQLFLSY